MGRSTKLKQYGPYNMKFVIANRRSEKAVLSNFICEYREETEIRASGHHTGQKPLFMKQIILHNVHSCSSIVIGLNKVAICK